MTPNPDNAASVPQGYKMTMKAPGVAYAAFLENKWTVELMVQEGYLEKLPVALEPVRTKAAIKVAKERELEIEIASAEEDLPRVQAELARAREAFVAAEKSGDQQRTHQGRKWVHRVEGDLKQLMEILGDRATTAQTNFRTYVASADMPAIFAGFTYVNDIHRIIGPSGFVYDSAKFDAHPRFAKRSYQMKNDGSGPDPSAWKAFIQSEVSTGEKVEQCYFDPRDPPGHIKMKENNRMVNTWRPVSIRMKEGDVTPFLQHLQKLFPTDWRILLNYLKFMMQHRGVKVTWWPFLQGVPGNGKSFISDTMEYCIGWKFTQRPTPKNIDGQFNASLYGCLFLALEDIKETDDFGQMWDTIKPMVTAERLEIQPKGIDKATREVCFNGIMNSNHKTGIKKDADDRRIAPFFSEQQFKAHLERDGLDEEYFDDLWTWAKGDGWAHVAYYLATDPIDADFNPKKCPVTSSEAEHTRLSRPPAQQILIAAVRALKAGFRGGWVNMLKLHEELVRVPKTRNLTPDKEYKIATDLGYEPHPGLTDGQLTLPLTDGTHPVLYVTADHPTRSITDPAAIAAAYQEAQK
jgi:Family of unknown function (DUF5906)